MFKLNDKKHRKRALMKLQCAPKCTTEEEKDGGDFYNVTSTSSSSNGNQVTSKTMQYAAQYNLEEAPNHLVRKTMKFEEVRSDKKSLGFDEVDNVESVRKTRTYVTEYSSGEKGSNLKAKVLPQHRRHMDINIEKYCELDQGHK